MGIIDEIAAIDRELSNLPLNVVAQSSEQNKLAVRLEDVWGSCALAGAALTLPQTRLLLQRGIVGGDRAFRDYLMVWGYGQASAWVQAQRPRAAGSRISVAEVRHLQTRAASGPELVESGALPGVWRTQNAGNVRGGMIPLPPALIVGELTALVDRFGRGPPAGESLFIWLNTGRLAAPPPELRPLSRLAGPATEEALRKAAIRGRLRHVYVGTRLFSTIAWRDEYLASRELRRTAR